MSSDGVVNTDGVVRGAGVEGAALVVIHTGATILNVLAAVVFPVPASSLFVVLLSDFC